LNESRIEQLRQGLASRYEVKRELKRGGMATVYLATDRLHDREVAVKVFDPEVTPADGGERFRQEIRIASRLQHPHILTLLDSGVVGNLIYYTTPFLREDSLEARLAREIQLPLDESLRLAREVAETLDHAHREGVVHRDIKPANILLSAGHAMVADFGIARAIERAGGQVLTDTGMLVGTPAYMSPEQVAGQSVDGRSDIYSLGCVLYEMLAGRPPFVGPHAQSLAGQRLHTEAPDLTAQRPGIPSSVSHAVRRALQPVPADRYPTAAEFAAELGRLETESRVVHEAVLHRTVEPVMTKADSRRTIARRWWVTSSILVLGAAAILVARGPLLGGSWGGREPPTAKSWILISAFEGPPDDPFLAKGAREIVRSVLDQSDILATIPDAQVRLALAAAGRPESTRVSGPVARELGKQGMARVVVEGTVDRVGSRLSIVLRAVDSYRDSVLLTAGPKTTREELLAKDLANLAGELQHQLRDRRHRTRPGLWTESGILVTKSFEAARQLEESGRLNSAGDVDGARRRTLEALRLDPDYALAWRSLGVLYLNLDLEDSARWAFREALSRRGRLPERMRLRLEAEMVSMDEGPEAAIPVHLEIQRRFPEDTGSREVLAWILWGMGRDEEALQQVRLAGQLSPFGPYPNTTSLEVNVLISLGRTEEAARIIETRMSGLLQVDARMLLACARDDWRAVDTHHSTFLGLPELPRNFHVYSRMERGYSRMARGSFSDARKNLAQAQDQARREGFSNLAFRAAVAKDCVALLTNSSSGTPSPTFIDPSVRGKVIAGYEALAGGDVVAARQRLEEIRGSSRLELAKVGSSPRLLDALIAYRESRWREVLGITAPLASGRWRDLEFPPARCLAGWLAGVAYESLGQPDSAVASYERALSPIGKTRDEVFARGLVLPLLRSRLVRLHAQAGRPDVARRHWEAILREVGPAPDRAWTRLRDDARRAIADRPSPATG
jgi:tetratricopeptide (TPR) repeat protein